MPDVMAELRSPYLRRMVGEVRIFLRDFKELNRLTDGFDHSDRHIIAAVLDTVSDWNSTPPFMGHTLSDIVERGWTSLFKKGCAAELLQSLMFLHMRNYLAYSDGGINVQTENPQLLQAALQMLKNEYEQKKIKLMIAANVEAALDSSPGVHSEYIYVNSLLGPW